MPEPEATEPESTTSYHITVHVTLQTFQPTREQAQQVVDTYLAPAIQNAIRRGQIRPN